MKRALKSPTNQYVIIIIIFLSLFFCSPTIQFNGGLLMCFDCQVLLIQLSSSLLPAKVLTALWHFLLIQLIDILLFSLLKNHSGFPLHTIRKVNFLSKNSTLIYRRKNSIFVGWKTRESVVVLDFLAVDNFDFTRNISKKKIVWKHVKILKFCQN